MTDILWPSETLKEDEGWVAGRGELRPLVSSQARKITPELIKPHVAHQASD